VTNATKAVLISVLNGGLGLLVAFHVTLTQPQLGAIDAFANALLAAWVLLTYTRSAKRMPAGSSPPGGAG
jgi:hypothetical protein